MWIMLTKSDNGKVNEFASYQITISIARFEKVYILAFNSLITMRWNTQGKKQ